MPMQGQVFWPEVLFFCQPFGEGHAAQKYDRVKNWAQRTQHWGALEGR